MITRGQWQASKRAIVDGHATPSDLRGALQLLSVIAPIAALWFVIRLASQGPLWLVVAATGCLSLFLLRGFVLMHDCGHESLFRSKRLNRAAGFLLGVLAGLPQPVWAENHRYHHVTNGNWARYRGPLNVACVSDYLAMSVGEKRRYRYSRHILMAPVAGCLYFLVNPRLTWLRASVGLLRRRGQAGADASTRPGPSPAHYRHMTRNNVVLLAACGLMAWWIGPALFLACYVVGGSLAGGYGLVLFTVQHNFEHAYASPDAGWDRDHAALAGTSFLILPRWLNWITADAAYHHVHHLCASVPNYRLARCHRQHEALFAQVRRVSLFEIPGALKYVLWDLPACQLVSVAEAMAQRGAQDHADGVSAGSGLCPATPGVAPPPAEPAAAAATA
jgi:acyl-lipid omega-6 desaturase (Delta-12 desaturase)